MLSYHLQGPGFHPSTAEKKKERKNDSFWRGSHWPNNILCIFLRGYFTFSKHIAGKVGNHPAFSYRAPPVRPPGVAVLLYGRLCLSPTGSAVSCFWNALLTLDRPEEFFVCLFVGGQNWTQGLIYTEYILYYPWATPFPIDTYHANWVLSVQVTLLLPVCGCGDLVWDNEQALGTTPLGVWFPVSLFVSCVTMATIFSLSELQFPYL